MAGELSADRPPTGRGRLLSGVKLTLGVLAAVALFAMMTLTFVDVVAERCSTTPSIGSVELTRC
jgi:hypothetical protein